MEYLGNKNLMDKGFDQEYQLMLDQARKLYPDIEDAIQTINYMTAQTMNLDDYLNLSFQTPLETSNNHIPVN